MLVVNFPNTKWCNLKGELKPHIHISLYESKYTSRTGCCPPFSLSDPMRGEFCILPSACPAPASSLVLPLLLAVTQGVALPLPAPALRAVNHRLQCSSQELTLLEICIKTCIKQEIVNPFILRVPLENIVCYFHAFRNNLGNKAKVHKIFEGEL